MTNIKSVIRLFLFLSIVSSFVVPKAYGQAEWDAKVKSLLQEKLTAQNSTLRINGVVRDNGSGTACLLYKATLSSGAGDTKYAAVTVTEFNDAVINKNDKGEITGVSPALPTKVEIGEIVTQRERFKAKDEDGNQIIIDVVYDDINKSKTIDPILVPDSDTYALDKDGNITRTRGATTIPLEKDGSTLKFPSGGGAQDPCASVPITYQYVERAGESLGLPSITVTPATGDMTDISSDGLVVDAEGYTITSVDGVVFITNKTGNSFQVFFGVNKTYGVIHVAAIPTSIPGVQSTIDNTATPCPTVTKILEPSKGIVKIKVTLTAQEIKKVAVEDKFSFLLNVEVDKNTNTVTKIELNGHKVFIGKNSFILVD